MVKYALNRNLSPTLIADYQLCLPNKEILENKLREIAESAESKDYDRYDRDSDYADGVDDAIDEFDED